LTQITITAVQHSSNNRAGLTENPKINNAGHPLNLPYVLIETLKNTKKNTNTSMHHQSYTNTKAQRVHNIRSDNCESNVDELPVGRKYSQN